MQQLFQRGTLRTLLSRNYIICSSKRYLHEEIKYIESTFVKINNYPKYVINQLNREVKLKHMENMNIEQSTINETTLNDQEKCHLLVLPYASNKGEKIMKSMNRFSSPGFLCNIKTCIASSGTKISSRFQLKHQTKKNYQHDVVYYAKCPKEQCAENDSGETEWRLIERVKDRSGKDLKSHLFKQSVETNHKMVTLDDFKIIGKPSKFQKLKI